jgi:predicted nucleic acid-binding protein
MAMTDAKTPVFVDTNALIRLHIVTASDHAMVATAVRRLILRGSEMWISRQVIREYASVLTRPQPYAEPASPADVAKQLRQFEQVYRIADETEQVSANLYRLMETTSLGGKQIHDANIVATMQAYNIERLFTLNTVDFSRFESLITMIAPLDVI